MNSLCLQLWVVLYSWNSRPVLTSNSDWRKAGSKLLTLADPPPHSLFQHLCLFCCVFFFFFICCCFFAISTSSLSLDIKFAILCTQKRFMRFFVAKTIFAIFAGKNDLHTSSGNFLRVQICHPKSLDIWSWSSSRVAKTCRPCDPVGAIFSGRC